jgi:hypothetical protein
MNLFGGKVRNFGKWRQIISIKGKGKQTNKQTNKQTMTAMTNCFYLYRTALCYDTFLLTDQCTIQNLTKLVFSITTLKFKI